MSRYLAFGLALPLLVGCTSDVDDTPPEPNEFQAFDDAVNDHLESNDLKGATAVIVTEDEGIVHMQAYGEFGLDRVTLLASASKIVSAGVLLRLADDGVIDLEAPISTYLGDAVDGVTSDKVDITVAQLLSNSAGMPGILDNPTYGPYLCMLDGTNSLENCAATIYVAEDQAERVAPDTEFRYGGGQWQLAGGVAEAASGKSWDELIDEFYVQPCGLESSGYNNHFLKAAADGLENALSYPSFFDGDLAALDPTENPSIEGGMYATIGDYAQILLMHLRGGVCGEERVLSEEAVLRMQTDRIAEVYDGTTTLDPTMPGYGMGWWLSRSAPIASDGGAYGATPWIDLDRRYGVMFLIEGAATEGALFRIEKASLVEELLDSR